MSKILTLFVALAAFAMIVPEADAKRIGGGRSVGTQRQAITPQQTPNAPQQQMAPKGATQQQAAPAATPAQPQPAGWRRWLGPIAGLAIGAGLASLFLNNGLGGALLGILLIAALIFGVVMLVRMIRGTKPVSRAPLQYAGAQYGRSEPVMTPPAVSSGGGAAPHSVAAQTRWPADFNAEEFTRHAKLNFIKLQSAHDAKDIASLSEFLTPDLLRDLQSDIEASGDTPQKTDVVTLDAEVLDVAAENGQYIVSVRFSGLIRETEDPQPQPFTEVWHLQKPVSGRSGWLVAGIQQA